MVARIYSVFRVIGLASLVAACAVRSDRTDDEVLPHGLQVAEVQALLRERMSAYPDFILENPRFNGPGTIMCATISYPGKRSYTIISTDFPHDGKRRTVASPALVTPDSWDLPQHGELSDFWQQRCEGMGLGSESAGNLTPGG